VQELTLFLNHDKNWYEGTYLGVLTHLEFALLGNKTQVCGVRVSFRSCSSTKTCQGFVVSVAHVRRRHLSVILFDLHLEWLATKNTQRKTMSYNMLFLFYLIFGLSHASALFMVISLTIGVVAAIISDVSLFHHQSLKLATRLVL